MVRKTFRKKWQVVKRPLETYNVDIYIAGDYRKIRQIAGNWCQDNGYCFSLVKTDYVYTNPSPIDGGASSIFFRCEEGAKITLINYPRFPISAQAIDSIARQLGFIIAEELNQGSFSIVDQDETTLYSRRHKDFKE